MNFLLNSEPTQNGSVLFVIIGVIVVAALYIGLAYLRKWIERKQIAEQQAVIPEEDDSEDESGFGAVNNNQIAVVTYGDRDPDTFAKTPYKSIILNYNSYAVRVTYKGTLYTVPSGGFVVIDYE